MRGRVGVWAAIVSSIAAGCSDGPSPDAGVQAVTNVEIIQPIELTDAGHLPEADSAFSSVEVHADRLVFRTTGILERPFVAGDVIAGVQQGGYLRRATAVADVGGGTFEVATDTAELVDLIGRGHFRIQMTPGDGSFRRGVATDPLSVPFLSEAVKVSDKCTLSAPVNLSLQPAGYFDATMLVEVEIDWGILGWRGRLKRANFDLSGQLGGGLELEIAQNVTLTCGDEVREEPLKWRSVVLVGTVPVLVTHTLGPTGHIEASGSIETARASASASADLALHAAATYTEQAGWSTIWEPVVSANAAFVPERPGKAMVSASLAFGMVYGLRLYELAGPDIDITRTHTASFTADPSSCLWTAKVASARALTIAGKVDVPGFDKALEDLSYTVPLGTPLVAFDDSGQIAGCASTGADCSPQAPCSIRFQRVALEGTDDPTTLTVRARSVVGVIAEVIRANGTRVSSLSLPMQWTSSAPDVVSVTTNPNRPQTGVLTTHKFGSAVITASLPNSAPKKMTVTVTCDVGSCRGCANQMPFVCAVEPGMPGTPLLCGAKLADAGVETHYSAGRSCEQAGTWWICTDLGMFPNCGAPGTCCSTGGTCVTSTISGWNTAMECQASPDGG